MPRSRTAVAVRDYLATVRKATARDILSALPSLSPPPTLESLRRTLWMGLRLGLLVRVGEVPKGPGQFPEALYGLVRGKEGSLKWGNPTDALWPRQKASSRRKKASRGHRSKKGPR